METKTMSFRDTIILAMSEEMRRDENVFLMGEDVGVFGGDFGTSVGMLEEFGPERVRDCPISEAAIAAVVVGETSMSGGYGKLGGTLVGALIIGILSNGLNLMNVNSFWQTVVKGIVILLAVFIDYIRNLKKSK